MSTRYRDAGVDLDAAEAVTSSIKRHLQRSLFGGFLPVPALRSYDVPVLVSSIDGVGTKVRLAARLNRVDFLGQDLVHHCVNDIAVHGATPLLFLDYLAVHRLEAELVDRIVTGIADACSALQVQLVGGETAEMPLVYAAGHFDLAGAVVGVVEQAEILDGRRIQAGDVLIGLPSSGLHTNGYSLVQQIFGDEDYTAYRPQLGATLGEALLEPHRCYLRDIAWLIGTGTTHGLAHITGGGIAGNLVRILPPGLRATVRVPAPPPLFGVIEGRGVPHDEMVRVFNMGIGLIAVCDGAVVTQLPGDFQVVGQIEPGERGVTLE